MDAVTIVLTLIILANRWEIMKLKEPNKYK